MFTFTQWIDFLLKGHGHKYIKRIPYNTPKGRRYRYIYQVHHTHQGKHVLDPADMQAGAKFMVHSESGKEVHAHITQRMGNTVIFKYDDGPKKGQLETMHVDGLTKLLDDAVGLKEKLDAQKTKLTRDIAQARKTGTKKQVARLEAQLNKINAQLKRYSDVFDEEDEIEEQSDITEDIPDHSHLSREQQENGIVATKAEQIVKKDFLGWFKNSVVVGEDGEPAEQWGAKPVKVFHGTPKGGFSSFSKEKDDGFNIFGSGFYFTENKEIAETYTEKDARMSEEEYDPTVFEVFLSLQKPIDLREKVDEKEFDSLCKFVHQLEVEQATKRLANAQKRVDKYQKQVDSYKRYNAGDKCPRNVSYYSYSSYDKKIIEVKKGDPIPEGFMVEQYTTDLSDDTEHTYYNLHKAGESDFGESFKIELERQKELFDEIKADLQTSKSVLEGKVPMTFVGSYLDELYGFDEEEKFGKVSGPKSFKDLQKLKRELKAHTKGKTWKDPVTNATGQIQWGLHVEDTDELTWQDLYYMLSNTTRDRRFKDRFKQWAESQGYDGLVHRGGLNYGLEAPEHLVYVAWEPNQIKATNAKYFNPNSTDIYNGDGAGKPQSENNFDTMPDDESAPELDTPKSDEQIESENNFDTMPDTESENNFDTMPDTESENNFDTMPDTETTATKPSVGDGTKKPAKTRKKRATPTNQEKLEDVGEHVWGSRADLFTGLTREDLDKMNPKSIAKEVQRDKLLAWNGLTEELKTGTNDGHSLSAMIMKDAVIKLIKAKPYAYKTALVDSKGNQTSVDSVSDYIDGCDFVMQSLDKCKSYKDVIDFIHEWRDLFYGFDVTRGFTSREDAQKYADTHGGSVEYQGATIEAGIRTNHYTVKKVSEDQRISDIKRFTGVLAGDTPSHSWSAKQLLPINKVFDNLHWFKGDEKDGKFIDSMNIPKQFKDAVLMALRYKDQSWDSDAVKKYVAETTNNTKDSKETQRKRPFKWIRDVDEDVVRIKGKKSVQKADANALHRELNLKNVQYGNWMDEESRKIHTKQCHEAFYDLADVLGIDASKVSLNGRLSIGFGARGQGNASAHYESSSKIINLTKFAGGGSLAHEWGHFLDNVIASVSGVEAHGGGGIFLSDGYARLGNTSASPQLQDAVTNVMKAILISPRPKPTKAEYDAKVEETSIFLKESNAIKKLYSSETDPIKKEEYRVQYNNMVPTLNKLQQERNDLFQMLHGSRKGNLLMTMNPSRFLQDAGTFQSNKNGYWTRKHELFARAFESYIEDELENRGQRNTYLVTGTKRVYDTGKKSDATPAGESAQVYPQGEERTRINNAMKQLIEVIKKEGLLEKAMRQMSTPFSYSNLVDRLIKGLR